MTINIYYSDLTKKRLEPIQKKYHVSISTIAETFCNIHNQTKYWIPINLMKSKYLDDEKKCKKTSIKPKDKNHILEIMKMTNAELSKYISNGLYCIANEKYDILLLADEKKADSKENISKWKSQFFNELSKKREVYYNYNAIIRNNIRALKDNKEYIKRLLDQMENK